MRQGHETRRRHSIVTGTEVHWGPTWQVFPIRSRNVSILPPCVSGSLGVSTLRQCRTDGQFAEKGSLFAAAQVAYADWVLVSGLLIFDRVTYVWKRVSSISFETLFDGRGKFQRGQTVVTSNRTMVKLPAETSHTEQAT